MNSLIDTITDLALYVHILNCDIRSKFSLSPLKIRIVSLITISLLIGNGIDCQTSYSYTPNAFVCGNFDSGGSGIRLAPVSSQTSGNVIGFQVWKNESGNSCGAAVNYGPFSSSGTLRLREGSSTGTIVKSISYSSGATHIPFTYTFPSSFTSGTRRYYVSLFASGFNYNAGYISVTATPPCTDPNITNISTSCQTSTYSVAVTFSGNSGHVYDVYASWAGSTYGNSLNNVSPGTRTITGIPHGQSVGITVEDNSYPTTCNDNSSVTTPNCGPSCTNPDITNVSTSCQTSTYSVAVTFSGNSGHVYDVYASWAGSTYGNSLNNVSPGTRTISGIPHGQSVGITVEDNAYPTTCNDNSPVSTPNCGSNCTDPNISSVSTSCQSSTYSVSVTFSGNSGHVYDVYASWAGSTYGNALNNVSPGTRTISGIPHGQSVGITVEDNAYPTTCNDSSSVSTPNCGSGACNYTDFTTSNDGLSEAQCLCNLGYLDDDGTAEPDNLIIREDLAKLVFLAVNDGDASTIAEYFPTPYDDLEDGNDAYHKYAKALLYLEYGDGIAPFNRTFTHFDPGGNIQKRYAIKVILEAFDIPIGSSNGGTIQNVEYGDDSYEYVYSAAQLGIIQNTNSIDARLNVTRRDVFIMIKRALNVQNLCTPISSCSSCSASPTSKIPKDTDYFTPGNLKLKYLSRSPGLSEGFFDLYSKTPFNIPSIGFDLSFTFNYNNFWLELPEELQKNIPLGKGWTHNLNTYIVEQDMGDEKLYVVWPTGEIHQYDKSSLEPLTPGVFDELTITGTSYLIKKKNQVQYFFTKKGDFWRLDGVFDRNQNILDPIYSTWTDSNNKIHHFISRIKGPAGRELQFRWWSYNINNEIQLRLRDVTDLSGNRVAAFEYNSNQNLAQYINPKGDDTFFIYGLSSSEEELLKKITYPRGNVIDVTYDENRKLSTLKLPGIAQPYEFETNPNYGSSATTVSVTTDDPTNNVSTIVNNDDEGLFLSSTTGNTTTQVNSRNNENQIMGLTYGGKQSSMEYFSNGNVKSITTPEGIKTEFTYTTLHDIETVKDGKDYTTTYFYDGDDNLDRVVDNLGFTTDYTFNNKGQVVSIKNPENITTSFTYDQYGNQTNVSSPLSISTAMDYDIIGRLTKVTNPKSQVTDYEYDEHDMIDKITRISTGGNIVTNYGFDENDNLTSITNALGNATTMTYNDRDQLTTQKFGDDTKTTTYDSDGRLDDYIKPSGTTLTSTYDNQGRVTNDGYNGYTYDTRGNVKTVTHNGTTSFNYDDDNRMTSYNDIYSKIVAYNYDDNNNVTRITYPGGFRVDYTYDRNNRMTQVSWNNGSKVITYSYFKDGRIKRMTYPNGTSCDYTYDVAGRMTGLSNQKSNGEIINAYIFQLDQLGNHLNENPIEPFSGPPPLAAGTYTGTYNNENEVINFGGGVSTFNADGNLSHQDGLTRIEYDDKDLLIQYENSTYKYGGLGLMREANRAGVVSRYAWDMRGIGNVIVEYAGNSPKYYYIHGLGLTARINASSTSQAYFYHSDFRGSTIALTDDNQNVTHKYRYLPFGEMIQAEETDQDNRFTYIGKYGVMHEGGGRYYMRARNYDSFSGRFIGEDPVWEANLYVYSEENPLSKVDPMGTSSNDAETFFGWNHSGKLSLTEPKSLGEYTSLETPSIEVSHKTSFNESYVGLKGTVLKVKDGGKVTNSYSAHNEFEIYTVEGKIGTENGTAQAKAGFDMYSVTTNHCFSLGRLGAFNLYGGLSAGSLKAGGAIGKKTELELGALLGVKIGGEYKSSCN